MEDPSVVRELMREVENEAIAAGAAPASLDVRVEEQADKGTVRAIATGAVGLRSGAMPGRAVATADALAGAVRPIGAYFLSAEGSRVTVLDRYGDPAAEIIGTVVDGRENLAAAVERNTRFRGPITLKPSIWVIDGARLLELSSGDIVKAAGEFATGAHTDTFIVGRGN